MNHPRQRPERQRGAITILAAFGILVMLGLAVLVVDIGRAYVVAGELQNAADACALGAVRELNDRGATAAARAKAAGATVGNANFVHFQRDAVQIRHADIEFAVAIGGPWSDEVGAATAYVRCSAHRTNPFPLALAFFEWLERDTLPMGSVAVARLVAGQTLCAIPIAMCSPSGSSADFTVGTWYSGRLAAGTAALGNYDWIRFPGMSGAADLGAILAGSGLCNLDTNRVDAEPGVTQGVAQAWNTRFGLYSGKYNDPASFPPDETGYAYTKDRYNKKDELVPGSWPELIAPPAPLPAGTASRPAANAYGHYVNVAKPGHMPYDPWAVLADNGKPVVLPGNPAPLDPELHGAGQDRRLVYVPIIKCDDWAPNKKNMAVNDYACALMLHPVNDAGQDVQLEFRGGYRTSLDCGTTGVPGDFGPPVPGLVR
ncbi:MAG: Tad domain-containing protein [Burkholderiales bacterium]|nr:Tad domain-containing protein [Burkholderiales bacterium]